MRGFTLQFWQSVVLWANIAALAGGILTGAALFVSAWVSSNIADVVQQDADQRILEARIRGDEARADAANANQRASEAATRAAEAEQRAAEARLRLAQITMPRRLTPEQVEKLRPLLAAINPKGKVVVKGRWPDEEAMSFAKQISELMKETGFEVVETYSAQHVLSFGNIGVNIVVRDINKPPPAAAAGLSSIQAGQP